MSAAATLAGAAPDPSGWHSIDWKGVCRTVRRLQARIVKAVREGRWDKVKALVYLLTHSFSGRALAVLRVTSNTGARTPGADGVPLEHAGGQVGGFQQAPSLRLPTPAAAQSLHSQEQRQARPLGIPTMTDRAMQALYLLGLDPIEETRRIAIRTGFACSGAAPTPWINVTRSWSPHGPAGCSKGTSSRALTGSATTGCWPRPDGQGHPPEVVAAGFLEKDVFFATTEGTPQGGIISPALANRTLDGLEPLLTQHFGDATPIANGREGPPGPVCG